MSRQYQEACRFLGVRSLGECLSVAALGQKGISFLYETNDAVRLSYSDFYSIARKRLTHYKNLGVKRGSTLVLVCESPQSFVENFWAAVLGGILVVPIAVPSGTDAIDRLKQVLEQLPDPWIVTDKETLPGSEFYSQYIQIDANADVTSLPESECYEPNPDDLALLQYSSGSTSAPKGVMVTHANLLVQIASCIRKYSKEALDRVLSWMPLTHDFGLILMHLTPLAMQAEHRLIATSRFIKDPLIYLDQTSEFRATCLAGPNSVFSRMLNETTPERKAKWDLSCVKIYLNGAEQIDVALMKAFVSMIAEQGFPAEEMLPGYGLAESTLVVSCTDPKSGGARWQFLNRRKLRWGDEVEFVAEDHPDAVQVVSIGTKCDWATLRLTDPQGEILSEKQVGVLEISGECNTSGYFGNEELTRQLFPHKDWLFTGDLMFMYEDHLYIVGRVKDLIILGGSNYYPHDIESVLVEKLAVAPTHVVATAIQVGKKTGKEGLGIFYQLPYDENFLTLAARTHEVLLKEIGIEPDVVVAVEEIPRTSSGKVRRFMLNDALQEGVFDQQLLQNARKMGNVSYLFRSALKNRNLTLVTETLLQEANRLVPEPLSVDLGLMEQGFSSKRLMALRSRIEKFCGQSPSAAFFFDHPTLKDIALGLIERSQEWEEEFEKTEQTTDVRLEDDDKIAVIGMACRFPKAQDIKAYWRLILSKQSVFEPVAMERGWRLPVDPEAHPGTLATRSGAWLEGLEKFDAELFSLSKAEANNLSIEQKLLLETAWHAFEHAGLSLEGLKGTQTGVWVGMTPIESVSALFASAPQDIDPVLLTGLLPSAASGRLSHYFDLKGPSEVIDTACSSSLVALHHAVQALRHHQCQCALVAGVNVLSSELGTLALSQMHVLSPTARCNPYSDQADGYIRGEGCGALVLKRLADAQKDGDRILAVIEGVAVAHDGRASSLTAPNGKAQSAVIEKALKDANLSPKDIDVVEGHGTGTPLGDPIELESLSRVFKGREQPLYLGSVKSQIGHLEAAAGMAGVIKTILGLCHKVVPPMRLEGEVTKEVNWTKLPLQLALDACPWKDKQDGRVALVSAFGLSGTNTAVILKEARVRQQTKGHTEATLLMYSARTEEGLKALTQRLLSAEVSPVDIAKSLSHRSRWPHRAFVLAGQSMKDIFSKRSLEIKKVKEVVFIAPGQGAEAPLPLAQLEAQMPVFKSYVQRAEAVLDAYLTQPLRTLLTQANPTNTLQSQCYAVVVAVAMMKQYMAWGIVPRAIVGHSVGEIAALVASGAFEWEEALHFVAQRAQCMDRVPISGAMLALATNEITARALIEGLERVDVAAVNGPGSCVISGEKATLEEVAKKASAQNIRQRLLTVPVAGHSSLLDPILSEIDQLVAPTFKVSQIPVISCLNAQVLNDQHLTSEKWWSRHCRETVRFMDALETFKDEEALVLMEFGARRVLAPSGMSVLPKGQWLGALSGVHRDKTLLNAMEALGELWLAGVLLPSALFEELGELPLFTPNYPFDSESMICDVFPRHNVHNLTQSATVSAQGFKQLKMEQNVPAGGIVMSDSLQNRILELLTQITGKTFDATMMQENWFHLGFDSLLIVQIQQGLFRAFGQSPAIELFYSEASTPQGLISSMRGLVGESYVQSSASEGQEVTNPTLTLPQSPSTGAKMIGTGAVALMGQQIEAMQTLFSQQLSILGSAPASVKTSQSVNLSLQANSQPTVEQKPENKVQPTEIKGLFKDFLKRSEFTDAQVAHIKKLAKVWNELSPSSKEIAALDRENLAGPRSMIGFKPEWKELVYPLIVDRAQGAYVWDRDGRRYVDITGGFGATIFGHGPRFVTEALENELKTGWPLGPQRARTGRVARKLCELTGAERAAFFTTGTESTMVAVRLARAVTKKKVIAIFTGAFHGSFDGFLAAGWVEANHREFASVPITDGTTQGMIDDVMVLRYGEEASLEAIRQNADRLAAVMVEPIQSRNPSLQPKEFVQELRRITEANDIALIFDEMITGFRMAPGGMREIWGVKADMTTYGKVLGGGMPMGAVVGKRRFLDAVDGGAWNYGDETLPGVHTAFVAGTFNQHCLTMAASEAILDHIVQEGPGLQRRLTEMTTALCDRLDNLFKAHNAPIRMSHYGSLFRFDFREKTEILNFHMLIEGIFVWEGRNCFISSEHTQEDIDAIYNAVEKGVLWLERDGWFGGNPPDTPQGLADQESKKKINSTPQETKEREQALKVCEVSNTQRRLWLHDQMTPGLCVYNIGFALQAPGEVDVATLNEQLRLLMHRHEALRTCFIEDSEGNPQQHILSNPDFDVEVLEAEDMMKAAEEFTARPFDLAKAPLWRVALVRPSQGVHFPQTVVLSIHHIVSDVWSIGILLQEFLALQSHQELTATMDLSAYKDVYPVSTAKRKIHLAKIKERLIGAQATSLPLDKPRTQEQRFVGHNLHRTLSSETVKALRALGRRHNCSFFSILMALWARWLHSETGESDLLFGTIDACRQNPISASIVGFFAETVPVRMYVRSTDTFSDTILEAQKRLQETLSSTVPFDQLLESMQYRAQPGRSPLFDLMIVQDSRTDILPPLRRAGWDALEIDTPTVQFDAVIYFSEDDDRIHIKWAYSTDIFEEKSMQERLDRLVSLCEAVAQKGEIPSVLSKDPKKGSGVRTSPASLHQERLWFVDRFEKGDLYPTAPTYYNIPAIDRLEAKISEDDLRLALEKLIEKRSILRTSIVANEAEHPVLKEVPYQKGMTIPLHIIEDSQEAIEAAIQIPIEISQAPLAHAFLTKDGQTLGLVLHHAVADRWSAAQLLSELKTLVKEHDAELSEDMSFLKFASQERDVCWDDHRDATWWKSHMQGMGKLDLPSDHPRTAIQLFEAGRVAFEGAALSFEQLRAIFIALLHRLSGDNDIVVGDVQSHQEKLLGPCSALLPLRSVVTKETTFEQLQKLIVGEHQEAIRHSEMPFDTIVMSVSPENDMSRTALFDVLFVADDVLDVEPEGLGWGKYDLVCSARQDGHVVLAFNRLFMNDETVERFARRMKLLMQKVHDGQAQNELVLALDVLLPDDDPHIDERCKAIVTSLEGIPSSIHEAFNKIAQEEGQRIAIRDGDRRVTYEELQTLTETIGQNLQALGAKPEERVLVLLDRSYQIPAAFIGAAKSGAAYVPLDPAYPDQRLEFILKDSQARYAITNIEHKKRLDALCQATGQSINILIFEEMESIAPKMASPVLECVTQPENLAYIIYTSGSTGTPKGVMVENRSVMALMFQKGLGFEPGCDDVWTLCHSPAFDFSVWEMYGALLFGGTLVIVPKDVAASPDLLANLLQKERVTILNQTPTSFYALSDAILEQNVPLESLKMVLFGGEALQPSRLAHWYEHYPRVRLVNCYGITETTVHTTWAEITQREIEEGYSFIGQALPAWGVMLLDEKQRPVPLGTVGEICVFGGGVARGYVGREEENKKRFLDLKGHCGWRLYRSGDLARWRGDGRLDYIGRMDTQVKIRGFRIEVAEVERVLLSHPAIKDAVVFAKAQDTLGQSTGEILAAYVVLEANQPTLTEEALRRALVQSLPEYMVPNVFYVLDKIPLTANGKVDKRILASWVLPSIQSEAQMMMEQQVRSDIDVELAQTIAQIWKEVLGIDHVSNEDNFFHLGGHSLKANRAVVRLRKVLGLPLSLKEFFTAPTLAQLTNLLAEKYRQQMKMGEEKSSNRIEKLPPADPFEGFPLSNTQQGIWVWQMMYPDSTAYNMVGGFRFDGALDLERLQVALDTLVMRHEALRTRFEIRDGGVLQFVDRVKPFVLEVEEIEDDERLRAVIQEELDWHFKLQEGHLLRVHVLQAPAGDRLVFNLHHIIADGWSVNVFLRELETLYRGEHLSHSPIQPREVANYERLHTNELNAVETRLLKKYAFLPKPLEVPADRERLAQPTGRGAIERTSLGQALSEALRSLAKREEVTLFMVLEALLFVLLYKQTHQKDLIIGSPVAGRSHEEFESTLSVFLNMVPLRQAIETSMSFTTLLQNVKKETLEAFEAAEYPFNRLLEKLKPHTEPGHSPLFDVIVILQNNDPLALRLPNLKAEALVDESKGAKYDLNFAFSNDSEMLLDVEYSTDLFDRETIKKIMTEFCVLAQKLVAHPEWVLNEILSQEGVEKHEIRGTMLENLLSQSNASSLDEDNEW